MGIVIFSVLCASFLMLLPLICELLMKRFVKGYETYSEWLSKMSDEEAADYMRTRRLEREIRQKMKRRRMF